MDGTFSSVPDQFSQLYVIFGSGGAASALIYPCAYALLQSKNSAIYKHLLTVLKKETEHTPKFVQIDFEQAVIKSVRDVFGERTVVRGCRFHRKKNLFFQVGQKGCLDLFYHNENFQVGIALVYCLDMVPSSDVCHAWTYVINPYFDQHFDYEENPEIEDFLSYVERAYIGTLNQATGERRRPMFPISIWNTYQLVLDDEPMTNNSVESWNARWNSTLGTNHNILRVVNAFKNEDSLARTKFLEAMSGRAVDPNPARKTRKESRHAELKATLANYSKDNMKDYMFMLHGRE